MLKTSPRSNVETTLLHLILDETTTFLPKVTKDLGEHIFKCIVSDGPSLFAWRRNCAVTVVTDIEGGAETMATLFTGISVFLHESSHILLTPEHTGDNDLMEGNPFYEKRIKIVTSYVLKQQRSPGHQIGNAARHALINDVIGITAHENEFVLTFLCLFTITDWTYAPATRGSNLHILHIWEAFYIAMHTANGMQRPVLELQRCCRFGFNLQRSVFRQRRVFSPTLPNNSQHQKGGSTGPIVDILL